MVTFAQAQERAEEWINGDVPVYQHREVRVREFDLGFVVWGEDRAGGPRSDAGGQRLVIARDSGEATLWPALPVGEVIRRYEEQYGRGDGVGDAVPAPAAVRADLNQTSFLLSPPEWLQEAADRMGIPDRRTQGGAAGAGAPASGPGGASGAFAGAAGGPDDEVPGAAGAGAGTGAGAPGGAPGGAAAGGSGARADSGGGAGAPSADSGAGGGSDAAGGAFAGGGGLARPRAGVPAGAADSGSGAPGTGGAGAAGGSGSGASWPAAGAGGAGVPGAGAPSGATPWAGTDTNAEAGEDRSVPLPATVFAPPLGDADGGAAGPPLVSPEAKTALLKGGSGLPRTAVAPVLGSPDGRGTQDGTPGAPQGSTPPPPGAVPGAPQAPAGPGRPPEPDAGDIADAATSRAAPPSRRPRGGPGVPPPPPPPGAPGVPGGAPAGGYVPTQLVSAVGPEGSGAVGASGVSEGGPAGAAQAPGVPKAPGAPTPPGAPGAQGGTPAGGVHHAATMLADPGRAGGTVPQPPGTPQPPAAPGVPGAPGAAGGSGTPTPPGVPAAPGAPGAPGGARGAVHHAETVLAAPPVGGPAAPAPPPAPGAPGMPPGAPWPVPPGAMPPPGMMPPPGAVPPGMMPPPNAVPPGVMPPPGAMPPSPPGAMPPPGAPLPGRPGLPPAYGYPQQGQPTVGPGYQAVLRYRAQDGSEQQLIRRSAPGTPHPEWQIFHELRALNVPPDQVLELHTELEPCELPGAYCARMIREQWPQARLASIAPYGTDHASRQQGMQQLLAHQGELHQVADGPARPAPVRAPLPPVQVAPPIPPEGVAQELAAAFGPGVFRFEHPAVSRQGVPPIVAHTLVVAGLPLDMGPFFWAQAQPGRPVPTLAELAVERGVRPAPDAGSYLVMGTDFGRAICVQYGTASIVAVPVEAGPGGAPVPPQFVNTGLPEFTRCLALLGRMWRLRYGLNQEQAGRWTVDFQAQLASLDPAALGSPETWWSVLLEQMWDGLL
ncbi:SUKH-4 family immunity protein [Streptomyces sp. TG1A-8]|uniref:SUKH-4 family immunity protein n=1 Tax=Streptomyces sp. TG1A-8 TaxID=3051385 RepID=UPI00265BAA21|nr:SUKH-4 family immunity protein [Streptomyces sp. TG1A-8]MDO0927344.1 SUKH-4 family immunity protein [Streptomyces sp. TG1A-8]